jgi:dipeptide/tripeptide permease
MVLFKRILGTAFTLPGLFFVAVGITVLFENEKDRLSTFTGCLIIATGLLVPGIWLLKSSFARKKQASLEKMEQAFYALVHNGSMATIADYEFAVQNKVTRKEAREFLEQKALELGASADANDRGMVTYTFGG